MLSSYHYKDKIEFMSTSQSERCSRESNGIQRAVIYGSESDDSTGYNSIKILKKMIQTLAERTTPFSALLDEPEIGCSEEAQAAIGHLVASSDFLSNQCLKGIFIISHSRLVVKHLLGLNPTHVCLTDQPYSLEEWVNREVVPANIEDILTRNIDNWRSVQKLLRNKA